MLPSATSSYSQVNNGKQSWTLRWMNKVRSILSRPLSVSELLLALILFWLLTRTLQPPPIPVLPPYHTAPHSYAATLAFPPFMKHCTDVYDTESTRLQLLEKEKDLTVRQWKAAQTALAQPSSLSGFVAELETHLAKSVGPAFVNDGSRNPRQVERPNYMAALSSWLSPELDRLKFYARPVPIECTTHAIVMIEGRWSEHIIFVIRHTFYMLRTDPQPWGLILFHTAGNAEQLQKALHIYPGGAGEHIELRLLDQEPHRNMANQLVMSPDWWSLIHVPTILLLQSDVLMMKPPSADLNLWDELTHKYIYVGGLLPQEGWYPPDTTNWNGFRGHVHTTMTGNGGCSIRQKDAHLQLLQSLACHEEAGKDNPKIGVCTLSPRFPVTAGPDETEDEDRWVGWQTYQQRHQFQGRIASPKQSQQFSVDSMPFDDPFFTHKYWQTWQDWNFPTRDQGMIWLSKIKYYYMDV